jgi:hypothetical protein
MSKADDIIRILQRTPFHEFKEIEIESRRGRSQKQYKALLAEHKWTEREYVREMIKYTYHI